MKYALAAIPFFTVLIAGCSYNSVEDLDPGSCDTTNVSYMDYVQPLISESCAYTDCHLGPSAAAQLDLSEYQQLKHKADDGSLADRINRAAGDPELMPPTGKLTTCQINRIEAWVNAGAPQN